MFLTVVRKWLFKITTSARSLSSFFFFSFARTCSFLWSLCVSERDFFLSFIRLSFFVSSRSISLSLSPFLFSPSFLFHLQFYWTSSLHLHCITKHKSEHHKNHFIIPCLITLRRTMYTSRFWKSECVWVCTCIGRIFSAISYTRKRYKFYVSSILTYLLKSAMRCCTC